ncbi:LuxR C-terminal-related transcriptional regulator [Nocardia blacklockiae]|uniref:LuxR C-terminal-related transcriptional regulator n=1 Tax=Nocardia blacklockiae TaxID=480036 RepID=UPI0018951EC9|nr:LuxR C-terminal-related transcriptional regulator [Nocardia blacklockiae]MBF6175500.1 LuxR family transcriptional regulator [Nocardia blacklockiae]
MFRELDSPSPEPQVYLMRGRSGTGKSTLLAALRTRLRGRGIVSCDTVAEATGTSGGRAALIVDDAHTLDPSELVKLCAAVESGCCTMVIATRPRPHDPALRAFTDAVARRGRVVDLRPLGVADIAPFARELGMMVPRPVAQHIHGRTAGIHGGVVAALSAACATRLDGSIGAVDEAVAGWARSLLDDTDPALLDAFVVAATGTGLDPAELTEVLNSSDGDALDLIDRARASALVTDADLLLALAVAPLRTLVGDRRFLLVQRRLLQARLDAGLLRDHTALLLAESGVRDARLAEFLCAAAESAGSETVRYYAAAAASGTGTGWRPAPAVTLRWAEAAARAGNTEVALRLAEPMLGRSDGPVAELAAAVRVCAGVWTRRGLAARAAELYSWLGPQRIGTDWAVGATVLYLAGDVDTADAMSASAALWPPTQTTARAGLIATALADSLGVAHSTNGIQPSTPDAAEAATFADTRGLATSRTSTDTRSPHHTPTTDRVPLGAQSPSSTNGFDSAHHSATTQIPDTARSSDGTSNSANTPGFDGTRAANGSPNSAHTPNPDSAPAFDDTPRPRTQRPARPWAADGSGVPGDTRNSDAALEPGTPDANGTSGFGGTCSADRTPGRAASLTAASALIQAARAELSSATTDFLPCTAVSVATLLCLSMGEPRRAADALHGAAAPAPAEPSGEVALRDQQLLVLSAWTSMLGGDEQAATQLAAAVDLGRLSARDRLLAHGVLVGLARRGGDHTALTLAWQAAHPLFDDIGVDLLALLPIGELWLAGIRLQDESRVAALVDAAGKLLRRLGNPPAWANAYHWYAIQAAIARERPDELLPHAQHLKAAAQAGDPHAAALADAGRTWVLALRGSVAPDEVAAAVRRLAGIGMVWDAARLASEAALAADDSTVATALLKLARTVRTESRPPQLPIRPPEPAAEPRPEPAPRSDAILSEREREVAELVLLGLTYREIGARLYISAKTVEHHVARIRRRIGAGSRSELLSMLRAMGHGSLLV